jgi:hypothetical protein
MGYATDIVPGGAMAKDLVIEGSRHRQAGVTGQRSPQLEPLLVPYKISGQVWLYFMRASKQTLLLQEGKSSL